MNATAITAATIALFCWGVTAIFDKFAMRGLDNPMVALIIRFSVVTGVLLAYGLFAGTFRELRTVPPANIWALVGSGLAAAVIGQFAYYTAIKHAEASRVVPFTASYPVVALILAVVILREPLTGLKVLGTFMIIGGLMLVGGVGGK